MIARNIPLTCHVPHHRVGHPACAHVHRRWHVLLMHLHLHLHLLRRHLAVVRRPHPRPGRHVALQAVDREHDVVFAAREELDISEGTTREEATETGHVPRNVRGRTTMM
jgi:hypothetical protein